MTRYREIGEELARRVLAGDLVPGDELPGIRELGRQWSTTASTASRAQRALAEAGLIELTGRRRALVAADAPFAARRFLHGHVVLRLAVDGVVDHCLPSSRMPGSSSPGTRSPVRTRRASSSPISRYRVMP